MFSVFGISKARARRMAQERIDNPIDKTLAEFSVELDALADDFYGKLKPSRIGEVYSNRSEAERFKSLLEGSEMAKNCFIKRGIRDKGLNPKNGKRYPVRWV